MSKLSIRFANMKDIDRIIEFIRDNWNKDHVLVKSRSLMEYQHCINNEFTYVLAEDTEINKIYGICGYIKSNNTTTPDIWTVVWKTIKSSNVMLGIEIIKFIKDNTNCRIISSCGINEKTKVIYDYLGYTTGKLNHYYRIADLKKYDIAVINKKTIQNIETKYNYKLQLIDTMDELIDIFDIKKYENRVPYKDNWYINRRYYEHPVYKYKVFAIKKYDEVKSDSILVAREIKQNGIKILRIVDYIGIDEEFGKIGLEIQNIIDKNEYEYVDFYCLGIDEEIIKKAGFVLKDKNDPNIIPNYFEPFVQKNVDINYFTNKTGKFYMFKADGDQDRPNFIK